MSTSRNFDFVEAVETAEEKQARENRLKKWEIKQRLTEIDKERIRPLAAIATNTATDTDTEKLAALEAEAQTLRAELAALGGATT